MKLNTASIILYFCLQRETLNARFSIYFTFNISYLLVLPFWLSLVRIVNEKDKTKQIFSNIKLIEPWSCFCWQRETNRRQRVCRWVLVSSSPEANRYDRRNCDLCGKTWNSLGNFFSRLFYWSTKLFNIPILWYSGLSRFLITPLNIPLKIVTNGFNPHVEVVLKKSCYLFIAEVTSYIIFFTVR